MIPAFLVMLREGLEAALIVGIIAAYLVKIGRSDALPKVWIGVGAAAALSLALGIGVIVTIGRLPLIVQETMEGVAGLIAVIVLTWMLFWMRRQGRAMKGDLERNVDAAIAGGSVVALAGLAFVSVAREGLETVLFMAAIFSSVTAASGSGVGAVVGSFMGLAVAIGVGVAIFAAGIRIDLRRFFNVTGILLIFVSAGLCAFVVHEFGEAGFFDNSTPLFNIGSVLPESSPIGAVLAGLFGYRSAPTALELIAYFGYLIPVLYLFLRGDRPEPARPTVTAS